MKHEHAGDHALDPAELQLIEQLRQQPELLERLGTILELTRTADGPLQTADEVEELLVQELRRLGKTSMEAWATQAEERVSQELKDRAPTIRSRKKNVEVVVCLWVGGRR